MADKAIGAALGTIAFSIVIRSKFFASIVLAALRRILLGDKTIGELKMLEGKEVEGKIGDVGSYFIDADATGKVKIGMEYSKDLGLAKVAGTNAVEVHILDLLQKVVEKTPQTWDDSLVSELKKLLGLQ